MVLIEEVEDYDSEPGPAEVETEHLLQALLAQINDNAINLAEVVPRLHRWLDVDEALAWDWMQTRPVDRVAELQLEAALAVFSRIGGLPVMQIVSQYLNPYTPWSNAQMAERARTASRAQLKKIYPQLAAAVKAQVLPVATAKVSAAGHKRSGASARGLRPALGFAAGSAAEEQLRADWKLSPRVVALSSVCALMLGDVEAWPLVATFTLNVLDDADPRFRAQGCRLLGQFLAYGHGPRLLASGLAPVFQESVETCLSYLPKLTPADVSLHLQRAAYPVLYELVRLQTSATAAAYEPFLGVLDNVLALIAHVQGRDSDAATSGLLAFLVAQVLELVAHVGAAVLACFSRTNLAMFRLVTSPFVVDCDGGPQVVDAALRAQHAMLAAVHGAGDAEACRLALSYRYDLLAAWAVVGRRAARFGAGSADTTALVAANVRVLREIAGQAGDADELEVDLQAVESTGAAFD